MSVLKRILIPVDFSELSENALEVAASIAKQSGAALNVFHMLGLSEAVFDKNESQEYQEARYYMDLANQRFGQFFENKPYLDGLKITKTLQNYKIFGEINSLVREQAIDLVVMGSHGTEGILGLFVGSNTEKVVRTSEVPVLVVKKRIPDFKMGKVVFGLDYSVEMVSAYRKALQFFGFGQAEVHLTHITLPHLKFRSTAEVAEKAALFFSVAHHGELPDNCRQVFRSDFSVEDGLYNYAAEIGADLIAVLTHGRKGLAHFFRGSVGEEMANHALLPVLTIRQ